LSIGSEVFGRPWRALRGASRCPPVGPETFRARERRRLEGCGRLSPAPLGDLAQPVTGGVKTPVTPTRLVLQRLLAIGLKTTIPAFFIFTRAVMTPLAFEAAVRMSIFGPLIRTRIPLTALPCWVT